MTTRPDPHYAGYRDPAEIIATAVWLYFRFPLSLRMGGEHCQHKGLNNRAENSHQATQRRERQRKRFKDPAQVQRFLSIHAPIASLFHLRRDHRPAADYLRARTQAFQV